MVLNNSQANINKVNGALADIFTNRPPAQSTYYIFYAIDTFEIWYDSASGWILLGSGGGTPVNIYTSDGQLNSDRNIDALNQNITWSFINQFIFNQYNIFNCNYNGFPIGIFSAPQFLIHRFGEWNQIPGRNNGSTAFIQFDVNLNDGETKLNASNPNNSTDLKIKNGIIETILNGNQYGFLITPSDTILGSQNVFFNLNYNNLIQTTYQGNLQGIDLNFANNTYRFGQLTGGVSFAPTLVVNANGNYLGLQAQHTNPNLSTDLFIGGTTSQFFRLRYSNQAEGIDIDFTNHRYIFGRKDAINFNYIDIDDPAKTLKLISLNAPGQYTNFIVQGGASSFIKTQYQNVDIGLILNFQTDRHTIGNIQTGIETYINVFGGVQKSIQTYVGGLGFGFYAAFNSGSPQATLGRWSSFSGYKINVSDNQIEATTSAGQRSGFLIRSLSDDYYFGAIDRGNKVTLNILDNSKFVYTSNNGVIQGLDLNLNLGINRLGNFGAGQGHIDIRNNDFTLEQINNILINGSVLSATSSGFSGQHLIVRINGSNYKLRLENP